MARIRSVHPGIWTDEAFASLQDCSALLFIGLWTEADDHGVFEWKPLTIKMRLRPSKAEDATNIDAMLKEMEEKNLIRRFEVDGRAYGAIRNFCRYQRPKAPKYTFPATPEMEAYVTFSERDTDRDNRDMSRSTGPMSFPRDSTAAERKRRQRQRERSENVAVTEEGRDIPRDSGMRHVSSVTGTEMSRQMEDGGWRMEDGIRKKDNGPAAPPPPDLFGEAAPLDKQGNPYAFVAGVIRVNRQTLDKWKRTYTNIPNIEAELLGMERWAGQQDDWFFAVQGSLTKKNRELGLERQRRAEAPGGSQGRPIKNLMLGK